MSGLAASATRPGRVGVRWTIVALLFAATTINYADRQVLGILAPTLSAELHWSESDYGAIVSWFSLAYGIGLLVMGRLIDWLGVRRGFSLSVVVWSIAAACHALARGVTGFSVARAALGVGESGNFPAALKAVAAWFPKQERALATGIFNAGTNVGAIVAPLIVPWIALNWGWRSAFLVTGAIGVLWLVAWLAIYREPEDHAGLSPSEFAHIRSGTAEPSGRIGWLNLLGHRQTWAYVVAKSLTDPVWFFYLFWLPKFLDTKWGVTLSALAVPLIAVYMLADAGSIGGGWASGRLIARGWSVNRGRKTAMLAAALVIVPTALAPAATHLWVAVGAIAVAASAHQWWSANLFTTASDMFPRQAVASVIGIGGFAGMMMSMAFQRSIGHILDATGGSYAIVFAVCGPAYVVALLAFHLLAPRMKMAGVDGPATA